MVASTTTNVVQVIWMIQTMPEHKSCSYGQSSLLCLSGIISSVVTWSIILCIWNSSTWNEGCCLQTIFKVRSHCQLHHLSNCEMFLSRTPCPQPHTLGLYTIIHFGFPSSPVFQPIECFWNKFVRPFSLKPQMIKKWFLMEMEKFALSFPYPLRICSLKRNI